MTDVLADLESFFEKLKPEELAAFDEALAPELNAKWLPSPGPQTMALESKADLLLFGGSAGGGKTDLLIGCATTRHERSVVFRRAFVDVRGLSERLIEIMGRDGFNGSDYLMRRGNMLLEFGALEKPGAELSWQGRAHDFIGFDEGAQLPEAKVRFVMGWLRSATPGQRCRVIIASNPPIGGEGEWLLTWFAPWLDPLFPNPAEPGELRWTCTRSDGSIVWVEGPGYYILGAVDFRRATREEEAAARSGANDSEAVEATSRTFVPAKLDDNPFLRNTGYRAQVMAMPEPLRSKLLKGDFLAGKEDADNQVIPTAWVEAAQARWELRKGAYLSGRETKPPMLAIGVDVAQGGKDETVLSPLHGNYFDDLIKRKGIDTKNGPAVAALVMEYRRNRALVKIDMTGGWGISAKDHLEQSDVEVEGVVFSAGSDGTTKDGSLKFLNLRSELWWRFREALDPESGEDVALPSDRRLKAQLTAPTWKLRGTSILIESKDDVRKRLGSSTDDADAVIMAWHNRDDAIYLTERTRRRRSHERPAMLRGIV